MKSVAGADLEIARERQLSAASLCRVAKQSIL